MTGAAAATASYDAAGAAAAAAGVAGVAGVAAGAGAAVAAAATADPVPRRQRRPPGARPELVGRRGQWRSGGATPRRRPTGRARAESASAIEDPVESRSAPHHRLQSPLPRAPPPHPHPEAPQAQHQHPLQRLQGAGRWDCRRTGQRRGAAVCHSWGPPSSRPRHPHPHPHPRPHPRPRRLCGWTAARTGRVRARRGCAGGQGYRGGLWALASLRKCSQHHSRRGELSALRCKSLQMAGRGDLVMSQPSAQPRQRERPQGPPLVRASLPLSLRRGGALAPAPWPGPCGAPYHG